VRNESVPGLRGPGVKASGSGAPQLPPRLKSESVRPWRLLGGPVCASLPNGSESIQGQCSASAALSSRTRSRCEAGQTVAAGGSIQNVLGRLLISQVPRSVTTGRFCGRRRDGSVLLSLHCMNDPQPEGHMASYIARRKFLATLGGA